MTFRHYAKRFSGIERAFKLVAASSPRWTTVYLALVLIQAGLPLALLYSFKLVVDQVARVLTGAAEVWSLLLLIGLSAVVNLAVLLFRGVSNWVTEALAQQVTDSLQATLHAKSITVDLEYYENDQYQDRLHRAQREATFRPMRIVQASAQVVQSSLSLLAVSCLILFSLPWVCWIVLVLAAAPGVFIRMRHARTLFDWQQKRTATERRMEYYNWMLTGPNYAKELRLFDLGSLFQERAKALRTELREERLTMTARRSFHDFLSQSAAAAAVFGCFGYVAYRAAHGWTSLGELIMLYQAFQRGLGFLSDFLSGLANLYENNLFLNNLYQFLDLKEKVAEPAVSRPFPRPLRQGIRFDAVSFAYATSGPPILDQVSFDIRAGEMVAVVGQNGAGKSTIIKLLCRLYDPMDGRITIDGIDLREFSKSILRKHVSVVFQDFAHYYVSAAENIWLGDIAQRGNPRSIEAAAAEAGIDQRIRRLPGGYDTVLGKVFEGGEELSIGEWQRVALARAFLRSAPIVILDEPSSALDAKAEYEIFQKFKRITRNRTSLVISHRLSTVRMADRIFVLDRNGIVESGTHDELRDLGGQYAGMFELQAENYR